MEAKGGGTYGATRREADRTPRADARDSLPGALCDLVEGDPPAAAGVSVSCASWDAGEALEAEAARRGVPADAAYYPVSRLARIVLRPPRAAPAVRTDRHSRGTRPSGALVVLLTGALLIAAGIVVANPAAALALLALGVGSIGISFWLEGPAA